VSDEITGVEEAGVNQTQLENMPRDVSMEEIIQEFHQNNIWSMMAREKEKHWSLFQRNFPKREIGRTIDISTSPSTLVGNQFFNPDKISLTTYKRMLMDSQVASAYELIVNAVLSRGFTFNGGEPEVNKFVEMMYDDLPMNRIFRDILSGFWVGFSVAEKVYGTNQNGDDVITKYKPLPPNTITFDVEPNGNINWVYQSGFALGIDRVVRWRPEFVTIFTYSEINDQFGNPYGVSGLKPAYRDWYDKDWMIRYQNRMLERVSGGMIVVNLGLSGNPEKIAEVVSKYRAAGMMVTTGEQKVEFHEPPGQGSQYMESIIYHDIQMAKAMLVPPILLDQSSKFGSRSLAQIHLDTFRLGRVKPLQNQLTELVDFDIRQIVDRNFGPQDKYPKIQFKVWSQRELEMLANYWLKLAKGQFVGVNDIRTARKALELPDADLEERGEPLIPPRGGGANSSGSAGDSVEIGSDAGSGGEMEAEDIHDVFSMLEDALGRIANLENRNLRG
jgi:hypothetical protein